MAWQSAIFRHVSDVTSSSFVSSFRSALTGAVVPDNLAVVNDYSESATDDMDRRTSLDAFSWPLECIVIDPWRYGDSAASKQNANFYLSSVDAIAMLKRNLEVVTWEAAVICLVTGATPSVLADSLALLLAAFPNQPLQQCYRHAKALATHDSDKLFLKAESLNKSRAVTLEQLDAFSAVSMARQSVAVAEAVASDTDPAALLDDFKTRRAERLADLNSAVNGITASDAFSYVLSISGDYLGDELIGHTVPDQNAPLCCVLAIGGSREAVAPLQEVFGL